MKKNDYLIVESTGAGMFSVFNTLLGALECYECGQYDGLEANFQGLYNITPNENWWEYYFEPIQAGQKKVFSNQYLFSKSELALLNMGSFALPRHRLGELVQKYVHVKKHIQEEVDSFFETNCKDCFTIGVHHRGTDKAIEFELIPYEMTYWALYQVIKNLPAPDLSKLKIYVATDDQFFLNFMLNCFPLHVVHSSFIRSTNGYPLHFHNDDLFKSNYHKGKEALQECLCLAKCNILIRPWSNLSCVASYFNSTMPVIVLEHPDSVQKLRYALDYQCKEILSRFSNKVY